MRFTSVSVEHFQAIIRADVAFGPGLNVLYGPNDFGKSTFAQAIRAALLVRPASSASALFQPWYADQAPRVALTLVDDEGHHRQVRKTFETGAQSGSAELYHSKDGVTFTLDVKGRQVEESLRAILGWGIEAPGGKGSPRGLPESFLAHTLLAAQTDVDRILGQSLADDATDTGKVRLSKALATLAQNPLFKKVLSAAQLEVDACFTPKGQRKRGQGSRFVEAGQVVKDLEGRLAAARKLLEEASVTAGRIMPLRTQLTERVEALGQAQSDVGSARQRMKRWRDREEADGRLRATREALGQIDQRAAEVVAAALEIEQLSAALRAAEDALQRATTESEAADAALRIGEEALRVATMEDGARERGLQLAGMKAEHAENSSTIQAAETQREKVRDVIAAREAAEEAARVVTMTRADLEKAKGEEAKSEEEVANAQKAFELAQKLGEYGHFRAAAQAVKDATDAAARALTSREEADARERDANAASETATQIETDVSAISARLTNPERLKGLVQLERDMERTEAALGGGLTILLRPRRPVAVHAVVDQAVAVDERSFEGERTLEAERSVRLTVGDLLEVDITAGAAEKRRELAMLRLRWESEAVPVLERSGLSSLSAVGEALGRAAADMQRVEASRRNADAFRAQAKELRARAALHDDQAAKLATAKGNFDAREAALRGHDPAVLEQTFAELGSAWEIQVATRCDKAARSLADARNRAGILKSAGGLAVYKVTDAEDRAVKAAEAAAVLVASLKTTEPELLVASLSQQITNLSVRQEELVAGMTALAAEATGEVQRATQAVERARARVAVAKDSLGSLAPQRDKVLTDRSAREGHRDALKAQLDAMDRSAAAHKVRECEEALAVFAGDVATAEADVQAVETKLDAARRALDETKTELHHAEGALSKVSGRPVEEEVARLQEAIECAKAREQELEVDADAHKLLLDTLREVENAEGAHLGRALSVPVAARFRELTDGRYGGLNLTSALKTEGVRPVGAGPTDVLDALSVGTRDQLATLIRLAIAEQLNSAIVLDDQLVQTDPRRLAWFRDMLRRTSLRAQVIVLTCRPEDYLQPDELPNETAVRDVAGGTIRAIDFARAAKRWTPAPSKAPAASGSDRPRAPTPDASDGVA